MYIKQLSVFLENKSGRLLEVTQILTENKINICAMSIADTVDFGILRMIVDNPVKAEQVLKGCGLTVAINNILAVSVENAPGSLFNVLNVLSGKVSVEYTYGFLESNNNKALIVISADNMELAHQLLKDAGIDMVASSDVYSCN